MLELRETKEFLRIDGDEEDMLVSSLIVTAKELVEEVLRKKLDDFRELPETVRIAMLIVVGTLYEERQVNDKGGGVDIKETLDLVRRMLFAYREDKF